MKPALPTYELTYKGRTVTLGRGRWMDEKPKTWKTDSAHIERFRRTAYGWTYAPVTTYVARDGSLRYEMYVDGSFYPLCGRVLFAD
jgi:hypothetical protein